MIILDNVSKQYVLKTGIIHRKIEKIHALSHINLTINKNECIGLIGLNGAGKSTLLKIILGILKSDSGNVMLFDKSAVEYRIENMKKIGVVFGQRSQLRWDVSPLDSYLLNKALYNIDSEEFDSRLNHFAKILGVDEFWKRAVRTLSLGQKMRADLLAALLHKPKLLILDEPTIGVDIISKRKILKLIHTLKTEITIIFTSHNLDDVYELCDRFIVLNQGKIVLDNSKQDVAKKIGYVTIYVTLNHETLHLGQLSLKKSQLEKINNFEYQLINIPKSKLTYYINELFANNQITYFSTKESDLESLLTELKESNLYG